MRVIISGGGTGGHIFPAVAIAKTILANDPSVEILFVGAEGRMEMEKVPAAGFKIIGLPIVGIQRRLTWKNLLVPFKVMQSMSKARKIIKEFKPDIAIGVGGYASGPLLRAANQMGVKTLIQEQNSYPGITNKLLAKKASTICVAYDGLEKFFPSEKIVLTGNPIRPDVAKIEGKREKAQQHFGLSADRKTVLIIGGSLGARTINEAVQGAAQAWTEAGLQIVWQTGKGYESTAKSFAAKMPHVHVHAFIPEMDLAYAAADIIISRAGAMSISELSLIQKPTMLIPSPNVSEDHQTKNAMALVNKGAAILVKDVEAREKLQAETLRLISDDKQMLSLSQNMKPLARPNAAQDIVKEVMKIVN